MKSIAPISLGVLAALLPTLDAGELAPAQTPPVVEALWPKGRMPGQGAKQPESELPDRGDNVRRITNVSQPTLTWFPAPAGARPAPAIIVCPGGGYSYVTFNKEGVEIAEWLNSLGITAAVLKYRTPHNREGALQDLQRSLCLARANAAKRGINPDLVGAMGFSAGGHLCAVASTTHATRACQSIDSADKQSRRPDFAVLVYPAYLEDEGRLTSGVDLQADIPPTLLVHNDDDRSFARGTRLYEEALRKADHPYKFLRYPTGGHGYGLRGTRAARVWPQDAQEWLQTQLGLPDSPYPSDSNKRGSAPR